MIVGCAETKPPYAGPAYPKQDLVTVYQVDADWPPGPSGLHWGQTPGLAIDGKGQVWVLTRAEVPVQIFTPDGQFVRSWGKDQFAAVHQIRFDGAGHVWIADAANHTVRKFTPDGDLLLTLGTEDEPGEDETHLDKPTDMAIAPSGDVFVADGYGNNRIVHFDSVGRFMKSWGTMGTGPGQFSLPHSIAMDSKGRLYVAGRNNNRIQVFDQEGRLLDTFPQVCVPWTIFITKADEVYVCGSSPTGWSDDPMIGIPPKDQLVMKFDTSGRLLELWTFPFGRTGHEQPGELNWVHGLAVDAQGNLYLGDIMGQRVQKCVRR
jgi:DNA-binding beta-propeller fold protein YncE